MNGAGKVVVTGASGFVGRHLVEHLRMNGWTVSPWTRTASEGYRCVDLCARGEVHNAVKAEGQIHAVVHLAALAHNFVQHAPGQIFEVNVRMFRNLLDALGEQAPHVVLASSVAAYGSTRSQNGPRTVHTAAGPVTPYGEAKIECEARLIAARFNRYDIVRFTPIFSAKRLVDVAKRVYLPGTCIRMRMIPAPLYTLCSIADAVEFIAEILKGTSGGGRLHLFAGRDYSQTELTRWFVGPSLPVPVTLIRSFVAALRLLPGRKPRLFETNLRKLFFDDRFGSGQVSIVGGTVGAVTSNGTEL